MEEHKLWRQDKVIDFVNWFVEVKQLGDNHKLENLSLIESFENGDDASAWHDGITIQSMSKEDLINMVKGVYPNIHLFENELIKGRGDFSGIYGVWYWNNYELEKLTEQQLYQIYVLCKDSW